PVSPYRIYAGGAGTDSAAMCSATEPIGGSMAMTIDTWLKGYRRAWESRDPDAAAALFTEDATYREEPYAEPFLGRTGVRDYWTRVTATQEDVEFRSGTPVVDGDRAAVEW